MNEQQELNRQIQQLYNKAWKNKNRDYVKLYGTKARRIQQIAALRKKIQQYFDDIEQINRQIEDRKHNKNTQQD